MGESSGLQMRMQSFLTNDGVGLRYFDSGVGVDGGGGGETGVGKEGKEWLIMIHGFTGSALYWQKNIAELSKTYRVIAPDLRGHGESDKPKHGYHVSRLAMDLKELITYLDAQRGEIRPWKAIGGSLGCAILWCYAELFTTSPFTHQIFVDQSPLQNLSPPDWDTRFCNRGMNTPQSLSSLLTTLSLSPTTAHKGTISACLSYLSHPLLTDTQTPQTRAHDENFFLTEALKTDPTWIGKLMADHTQLDWRDTIENCYGQDSGSKTKVLVLASTRSGCFPAMGPMRVVELVNGKGVERDRGLRARGEVVEWGGHWMFWEDGEKFNEICGEFLGEK